MKDHVRILVCGDENVGKSTFIGTLIAKNFAHEVPGMVSEVHIPPEENEDEVFCTITDSSALPRDRQQLVEKMRSAESILVLYDAQRPETLAHLDTFWLPLIEANAKNVPVVIVRNKMDLLEVEGGLGERSVNLEHQMEPLEKRYSCFHVSLECSSKTQMGINQALCHARSAALYPRAPLYDADEGKLRPLFDRAMRRLFRIYDADRDGLLSDDELNAFQLKSFDVNLSQEDHNSLRTILDRLATRQGEDVDAFVRRPSEGVPGGFTVKGFLRLMQLFIDKKQMKAPWQAMVSHYYDEDLVLSVPPEVSNPPPGKTAGHDQVLALPARKFLLQLFQQFSEESSSTSNPASRLLTEAGQAEVFSVIPDPACAPWETPRSRQGYGQGQGASSSSSSLGQGQEDSGFHVAPFARLGRAPGAGRAMTVEGWLAHWQMLALHSPLLLRSHLFYVGFNGHAEDMLADKASPPYRMVSSAASSPRRSRQASVIEVFVLGSRGCGKSSLIKALRLGDDLKSQRARHSSGGPVATDSPPDQEPGGLEPSRESTERELESQEALLERREGLAAASAARSGSGTVGSGGPGGDGEGEMRGEEEEAGWEMVADPEVPETCCGFARLQEERAAGSGGDPGSGGGSSGGSSSSGCASLSVTVTEVPESYTDSFMDDQVWRCDLALLVFDPSSRESLDFITPLLADIPLGVPRLLVSCESSREPNPYVVRTAEEKCKELELSPVVMADPRTGEGLEGDGQLRQKITDPVSKGMLPFEERHRKADRNRKIYIAVAALAVAAGIMYAVSSTEYSAAAAAANIEGGRGGGGPWEGGALRAPVRAAKRAAAAAADYLRRWRSGRVAMLREGGAYVGTVGSR
eukprot:g1307.t1